MILSRIKKGGFTAGVSVHDPSVIKDNDTYYIFWLHMESAKSADLKNWIGFLPGSTQRISCLTIFDGEEDGDPAAFTYVGKNEERTLTTLTAVPYYTWGNRGENQMRVWMRGE